LSTACDGLRDILRCLDGRIVSALKEGAVITKIKSFLKTLVNRVKISDISGSSVRIAYFIMLSLLPMLITVGALIPFFNISPETIMPYIEGLLPMPIVEIIEPEILSLLTRVSGGTLTLGIVGTIWAAGAATRVAQAGVDKAYGLGKTRHFITSAVVPVFIFIMVILLLMVFLVAFSFGEEILESVLVSIGVNGGITGAFNALKLSVSFLVLFFIFAVIYKVMPNIKHRVKDVLAGAFFATAVIYKVMPNIKHRVKDVLAGAFFATAAMLLLVWLFSAYLAYMPRRIPIESGESAVTYGVLGSLFVLGVWLRLFGYILLLGATLNAGLYEHRYGQPKRKDNPIDDYIARTFNRAWTAITGKRQKTKSKREKTPRDSE
jgi:Predicted membrane protein